MLTNGGFRSDPEQSTPCPWLVNRANDAYEMLECEKYLSLGLENT